MLPLKEWSVRNKPALGSITKRRWTWPGPALRPGSASTSRFEGMVLVLKADDVHLCSGKVDG